mgnify:CR=1 FL=1
MSLISRLNPAEGISDFWEYFKRPQPYRLPILALSALISLGILSLVIWQKDYIAPPRPEVTYITTFEDGRTDAEILAGNIENQRRQDELRAADEARAERRREIYRDLGRATGMDVDAIDERVARERAAEQEASERRRRELTQNVETPEEALADQSE